MKSKLAAFLFLFSMLGLPPLYSQLITGKVIAETGLAAPSVSVKFMNKANTILTNADGSFKIMATKLPDTLVFTAIGYEPYKVTVTDKTVKDAKFEVVLLQTRNKLSEVVVTGYGAKKKREHLDSYVAEPLGIVDAPLVTALEGKVAGLSITPKYTKAMGTVGSRSSIRIRGTSSASGSMERGKAGALQVNSGKKIHFDDLEIGKNADMKYQTKLVTAGEVNDFNKWKMWEDFSETAFKAHSQQWKLYTNNRYCVQVQHQQHGPAAGVQVSLINAETKDTVWQSVTDNTGKAELWAGLNESNYNADQNYSIAIKGQPTIQRPTVFAQGINRVQLASNCEPQNQVDIAFVVDATGSMGDEIEFLKLELEEVLRNTFNKFDQLELRASSVFYRDKGDEYVTKHVDFNADLLKVLNFIKLQKAGGGGDTPEAVDAALETAIDSLSWSDQAHTKLLFLVLDAPPHAGTEVRMAALMQKASAKGIRIIPIVCSGADKGTEFLMRSMALATNGTYVFLTDDSGIGGSHQKPTTDVFTVELLNGLLQRLIGQALYMPACVANGHNTTEPFTKTQENILQVKVIPNPTVGPFKITSNKVIQEMYIADFTGKLLMRLTANKTQTIWNVDLSQYPNGTYLIRYVTTENQWGASKVVVAR